MDPAPDAPVEQPIPAPPGSAPGSRFAARVRTHPVASAVVAGVVVAAAVVVGFVMGSADANGSGLSGALAYAPSSAAAVEYTDWAALGHSVGKDRIVPAALGGQWLVFSQLIPQQLGVDFAQSDWELFAFTPNGACDVFQWPDGSGPSKIASGLVKGGWRQQTSGSRTTLSIDSVPTDDAWTWTVAARYFGIDASSHRVAQCTSPGDLRGSLDGYGAGSFGAQPSIGALTSAAGGGVSAEIRTGPGACIPPRAPAQRTTDARFTATELTITNATATTGTFALAYPSSSLAGTDLAARKAAFTAAQAAASAQGEPHLKLVSIGTDGPVTVARIGTTAAGSSLVSAEFTGRVGLDGCGG